MRKEDIGLFMLKESRRYFFNAENNGTRRKVFLNRGTNFYIVIV